MAGTVTGTEYALFYLIWFGYQLRYCLDTITLRIISKTKHLKTFGSLYIYFYVLSRASIFFFF